MAASEETCAGNPNFAIICSFITKFGNDCGVDISIPYLQEMLEDTKTVHQDLLEIILHLMRRGKKRVNKERWEKCLVKFCHEYSSVDAWEIERFGFLKSKLSVKLELLKRLLELQFDANAKFKAEVNKHDAAALRLLPIGKDIEGQAYWYQLDKDYNMRLYRETYNGEEESSWQLLCSTTEDLKTLIDNLEKKYSCADSGTCEDKLHDPKSPSSDMPVPKKEQDGEEMTSCLSESKPCTIIIKTEKKEPSDATVKSENCAIVNNAESENSAPENVTKGSVKLKLKLESSSSKNELNSTIREYSIVTEKCAIPSVDTETTTDMDIDKTTETTESVLNSDIEMKSVEALSTNDSNSLKQSEEQTDQNIPNNSITEVDTEKTDSVNHKSSKIKLYEKWSNEKKKLDAVEISEKESCLNSKDVIENKKQPDSLSVNKTNEPAIPPKSIPELPIKDQKSSSEDQTLSPESDVAVDLSKSSRVNVIVQNTNSKPLCSNDASSCLKSSDGNSVSNNDDSNAINLKMKNDCDLPVEKASEKINDLKKRPLECESDKFYGKNQVLSGYYDVPAISDANSTSGFSHLQALQNMCETNSMGGIPSVIQSTNRLKGDSNKTVISENKSVSNTVAYEKMSKNYNFNDVHTSIKSISSDHEASNILLKSNVQMKNNAERKNEEFCHKNNVSNFKESVSNESNKSQEQPEDLSSQVTSKSKISELKIESNTSVTIDKHQDTIKTVTEIVKGDEKCASPVEKDLDAPKLFPCVSNECDSSKNKVNEPNSSKPKSPSPISLKINDSEPEKTIKDPCSEQTSELCSKSVIQSTKIDNSKIDISDKASESKALLNKCSGSSLKEKVTLDSEMPQELSESVLNDEKLSLKNIPTDQKSSNSSMTALSLTVKKSHTESFESALKDSERKFSVFSKPSSKINDIESCELEVKTQSELKIIDEFGSESKDSLSEPPDLKESCNSAISISEEYKVSSPSNESEISGPPPLLKEDLKTPVRNDSPVLTEFKDNLTKLKKSKIKDKSSAETHSTTVDDENQKIVTNASESTVSIDDDKSKNIQYESSESEQIKENDKMENGVASTEETEKKIVNGKENKVAREVETKKKAESDKKENTVDSETETKKKAKNDKKENEIDSEVETKKKSKNDKKENKIDSEVETKRKTKNDKKENGVDSEVQSKKKTKNDKKENKIDSEVETKKKTKNDKKENEVVSEVDTETKCGQKENESANEADILKKTKNDTEENEIDSEAITKKKTKNDKKENEVIDSEAITKKKTKNDKKENEVINEVDTKTKSAKNKDADIKKKTINDKKEKEIVSGGDIKKKATKLNDTKESEPSNTKNVTKSRKKKSESNLNDKITDSESDTSKVIVSESGEVPETDSINLSEEIPVLEKESTITNCDSEEKENKSCKDKENTLQLDTDSAKNDDESSCSKPASEKKCDNSLKDNLLDSKDTSVDTAVEKVPGKEFSEHSKDESDIALKNDSNAESQRDKENKTSCLENDLSTDIEKNQTSLDNVSSENPSQKPAKSKGPGENKRLPRRKGRASRWTPSRRTRRPKISHEEIEIESEVNENAEGVNDESKECPNVNIDDSSANKGKKSSAKASDSVESAISSENTSEMFKMYNLRHSTCLETKSKHPMVDKYVKSPVPILCIDISNSDVKVSPTKARAKGKNTKQPVTKKPEPAAKPVTPAKKTPPASSKKKPARNQKKVEVQKDDFEIPEGFLEILDKETNGKKRKGGDLKLPADSQNSSDNDSMPRKRSRRIQEQHQKKMTELAVEMEREQRILEQLAKRSNKQKNNKSTPQKTPEKPTPKGAAPKNTPTKAANTPAKNANTPTKPGSTPAKNTKSPRTPKTPIIIAEEDTLMDSRRTTRKMNSRSKNLTRMTLLYEDESKDSNFSTSRETEKSKKRRRRKRNRKGTYKPWDLSSESSSSIEIFTEEEEEEQDEPLIFEINEDEFACEEVDPNAEPVIVRRARTAKKIEIQDAEEECINDDTPCQKCGKYDKPEWILLCDKCDKGYHTHCLIPPLMIVPDGDWFCQPCEHLSLCQCLHEELNKLEVILKQREREALRKQRLAYVGISLDNVLKPEKKEKSDESAKEDKEEEEEEEKEEKVKEKENRKASRTRQTVDDERNEKLYGKRSVRARRNVNYQFKEYDELIFSALQEDMIEVPEEFKEELGSDAGSDKPFTASLPRRKKRGKRFTDFGSSEEDSEDEYQGGSTDSEATAPPSSVSGKESGSGEEWRVSRSSGGRRKTSQRKPQSSRRRRRRRGRGDSSEEDWEDEVVEPEPYRPTTRRAAQKAVSYREISSEEDEWGAPKRQALNKRRKASSSESESSFKKKVSKKKRIRKWGSSESSEESEEKSMSSSGETEEDEEEDEDEEESGKETKDEKNEQPKEKLSIKKKVLNSDDDDEEVKPTNKESVPKKKVRKVVSEESEEEDEEEEEEEEEEEDEEEEEEEEEEESESEEESADEEKRIHKKSSVSEKKVSVIDKKLNESENNQNVEKKGVSEQVSSTPSSDTMAVDTKENQLNLSANELQPKVLIKKELCSVDIPLELNKPTITITPVDDKSHPKTVRKEATKMVPCVIPYEKSPKGNQVFSHDAADKNSPKEVETLHPTLSGRPPIQIPKQSAVYAPPPSSRIQYTGALPRHSVLPISSPMRPSLPSSNLQSRMPVPTNLSVRPSPNSVVVQHSSSSPRMPLRPPLPVSKSTSSLSAPPSKQTVPSKPETKPYKSTIMEPFSNMDDENDSDDEVPLERIPTAVPVTPQNRPVSYEKDAEYRPAAKELSSFSYAPSEEKQFSGSYSTLSTLQDLSTRPSPLKPSLVETYSNNSSPSKLTPLDSYSRTNSPKGFISLDSYSENKKKKHFYGNSSQEGEPSNRPPPPPSENYQGGEIRFPPEPYPCPQSPNSFPQRSPPPNQRDAGTPPRLYSQFPDAYAPPRSPEYYQNHQYYASEERIPRPSYQPNYVPPEPPSFVSNPYVATPVPQPNGGFMIDTLLQARNPENEDELTGVTDIVSYITQE